MGNKFYQVKIGLYVLVIIMVGILFAVRVYNAWQRTNYSSEVIFRDEDVEISLHYPAKILSAKNDTNYPITLSFYYTGDKTSPHTYEIFLQSSTLLFVDAKGDEITPRFRFANDRTSVEQSVYVRPYLSEDYPNRHVVDIQAFADGEDVQTQLTSIEIKTESWLFSFFSLAAASLVEISVATALLTWIVNAIDASWAARKERVAKIRGELAGLSSLSYLEQMDKVSKLEDEVNDEYLDDDVGNELQKVKRQFENEEQFFRILGEQIQHDKFIDFPRIQKLHNHFCPTSKHKHSRDALEKILGQETILRETALQHISAIMKLWDDFDADTKDLIVGALKRLAQKVDFSSIPVTELLTQVFGNSHRRRLLRDVEIKTLFLQLDSVPPVGYDAQWLRSPNLPVNPRVVEWLKQHNLAVNPFGVDNLKNFPFYPEGFLRPNRWEDFLISAPQSAQCPSLEDARALALLLRSECLPARKVDAQGNEAVFSGRQVFPIWVSVGQTAPLELPLITLTRSAARAWMEILPSSPDAMLDLVPADQVALLELLCWAFSSNHGVINLLKWNTLKNNNTSARLLIKKIEEFKTEFSSTHLPQDSILLSWLKVRPPNLNHTYLILPLDEFSAALHTWWLEQFSSLIPTLFLHGIVVKAFSSLYIPVALPLSVIQLYWSKDKLKMSLNSQFELAMDNATQKTGKVVDFRSLFGFDSSIGYFESEQGTTDKLISASHNSLARMLNLGNRLFQYHCENRTADGIPEKYLYVEDLQTILNSA